MKHLGDIKNISGYEAPIVDVITGGSPCQDLSVAGKRAGLAGQRSGLFMEQMRIVKEMRERDVRDFGRTGFLVRPRYMVWENVPGAFSSGTPKGADFAAVIEEIIKVAEPGASVSVCVPNGGWTKSGCYYAEDGSWSIAWRVHDAQFWGVPQRRKRISLVADFGGMSAPEVLFERKGLSRDSEPCGAQREEAAGAVGGSADGAEYFGLDQQGGKGGANFTIGVAPTLAGDSHGTPHGVAYGISSYDSNAMKSSNPHSGIYEAASGGTNTSGPKVLSCGFKPRQGAAARSLGFEQEKSPTINTDENYAVLCLNDQGGSVMGVSEDVTGAFRAEEHGHQPIVYNGENITSPLNKADPQPGDPCHTLGTDSRNYLVYENHSQDSRYRPLGDVSETVSAKYGMGGNNQPLVVSSPIDTMHDQQAILCGNPWDPQSERVFHGDGAWHSLAGNSGGGQSRDAVMVFDKEMYNCGKHCTGTPQAREDTVAPTCRADAHSSGVAYNAIVRRLTPLECERLQGYPDGWTNIGEWVDSKGKKHKDADSPRYKALGNSIALPFWQWMARRICAQYERTVTMASLFDGIGGFPLAFERAGAAAVWASEIEEFPIAVTKLHFPEREETT